MSAPHAEQIVSGYLARLEQALATLPPARRAELVDDVRSHIAEARRGLAEETDADFLNILDKLGDPADIAADARERLGAQPAPPPVPLGILEIAAIVALVLVWPAGIALVWLSSAWSQRDKLIATVFVPGGVLALGILSGAVGRGYFSHFYILIVLVLITPVVWSIGAIYLAVRLYQARRAGQATPDAGSGSRLLEIAAVVLTPLLWPIGVILLWTSTAWDTRDKVIGTLVPPGGYFGVAVILASLRMASGGSCTTSSDTFGNVSSSCTTYGPPRWVLLAVTLVLLVLPLCTATYLAVRLRGARLLQPAAAS
ncbi:MAG TPA: hypothetical protein VJO72_13960 [Candidatus Dormibacteraeota bacterium]|nr:hypothetical protein [Candidatus Dormibacteraeota bacterium]